jgi:hypothetical protein
MVYPFGSIIVLAGVAKTSTTAQRLLGIRVNHATIRRLRLLYCPLGLSLL